MTLAFTPATQRALDTAARYRSGDALELPETLLGLSTETECLAAVVLGENQIDAAAVLARFPQLVERPSGGNGRGESLRLSPALKMAIAAVEGQFANLAQELATEHLLLGILLVGNEVADWLIEQGLDAAALQARVIARYASTQPIEIEDEPEDTVGPIPPLSPRGRGAGGKGETPVSPGVSTSPRVSPGDLSTWRALDASANRAREGLRVVEDYVRFALDDPNLTLALKRLRHELADALTALPRERLYASRDTAGDVGTAISTPSERHRADLAAVVAANFRRVGEALRSLEEFSKVVADGVPEQIERLRYRMYTIERAVGVTVTSRDRLHRVQLCVLVDGRDSLDECGQLARSLVAAGVDMLQLRDKRLDDRELIGRARQLREITRGTPTLLVINDLPDVAVAVQADGVHLGQEDMSLRDARRIVGPDSLIGLSTHSLEQAKQAVLDGANYLGVGPTFPSTTKQFEAFTGTDLLRQVAAEIRLPALAIGGITAAKLPEVIEAGFTRIAVSGAVTTADDPAHAAGELLRTLRSAPLP